MKLKPSLIILLAALLLNGCTGKSGSEAAPHIHTNEASVAPTDNRMSDPALLDSDGELHIGDIGVTEGRFRTMEAQLQEVFPNPSIVPQYGSYASNVISFGKLFLGTPYEYGSDRDNPNTFDCSDFTRYAFLGALGMDLPKDSRSQSNYVATFSKRHYWDLSSAKPGDLLFFTDYKGPNPENYWNLDKSTANISHCGIYLGDGYILHTASKATGGVRIDYIFGKHLEYRFLSGGSVLPPDEV